MRIAIDYTPAVAERAGIGRFARGLVRGLSETDRANEYVLLVPKDFDTARDLDLPANFRVRRLPFSERRMTQLWQRLRLPVPVEAFCGRVDIFHSLSFVLPPALRARRLVTIHDLSFLVHPECADASLVRYLSSAVRRSVRRADVILADSQNTRQDVIRLLGAHPDTVKVVYGGVEPRFVRIGEPSHVAAARLKYGLSAPYFLAVGTLEPRKNHGRLIEAYSLLRKQSSLRHELLIAGGKGWLYHDLLRQAGAQDGVRLLGFVPDEDLPALLSLADMFVFPSIYEGFGLPVLEAMACGTPVIATNRSSVPEVAGDAALLVDPSDTEGIARAMRRLLSDLDLRGRLVDSGYRQAARFCWSSAAESLLEVYREVI